MSEQPVGKVPLHIKEYAEARDRPTPSAPDAMVEAMAAQVADAVAVAIASVSVAYSHSSVGPMLQTVDRLWSVHETGGNPFEKNEWLGQFENKEEANALAAKLRKERATQAAATVIAEAMAGQAALLQAFMEANPPLTNAALRSELAAKDAELAELRAEIEALRGAHREIGVEPQIATDVDEGIYRDATAEELLRRAQRIARAALGSAEG